MLDMHLLDGALLALAIMVGVAIALSVAMVAAAAVTRHGPPPRGGTRRDVPRQPAPDDLPAWPVHDDDMPAWPVHDDLPVLPLPDDDRARELVLR
jgi:hypothetical protein